jgi:DNA processing protein
MDDNLSHDMDGGQARYWLALLHSPHLGSRGISRLLAQIPDPADLFNAPAPLLDRFQLKKETREHLSNPDWSRIEADLAWLAQPDNHLITIQDPSYPPLLKEIPDPPPALFVHGNPRILGQPQLAIVGSRNPSASGKESAHGFAHALASIGLTITSGLAIGIDAEGHEGALAGGGQTIAVAGTGLDRVYPARHHALAHRIAQQGALVSEFTPNTPARAGHFPRRNRIISGLSLGTLVVEAAMQSGSLITAHQAIEQGREVFAIPGSIHNPLSRGCHALIRQGAKLVETAQDIMEELEPLLGYLYEPTSIGATPPIEKPHHPLDAEHQQLLGNVGFDPAPIDQIIRQSGLTAEAVSSMLLVLELEGHVLSAPGGRYCRTGKS